MPLLSIALVTAFAIPQQERDNEIRGADKEGHSAEAPEIVVTGKRRQENEIVEDRYDTKKANALGAFTIGELIDRIQQRRGGPPLAITINGRRVSTVGDLREVSARAIENAKIVRQGSDNGIGLSAGSLVLDIQLKKDFQSTTIDGGLSIPTEGAGDTRNFAVRIAHIKDNDRFNSSIQIQTADSIALGQRTLTSEELLNDPLRGYKSIVPDTRGITANVGWASAVGTTNVTSSISASKQMMLSRSRFYTDSCFNGLPGEIYGARDQSKTLSLQVSTAADGAIGEGTWNAELATYYTGNSLLGRRGTRLDLTSSETAKITGLTPFENISNETKVIDSSGAFSISGPVKILFGSKVQLTSRVEAGLQQVRQTGSFINAEAGNVKAFRGKASSSVTLPLADGQGNGLPGLGVVSTSITGSIENGGLGRWQTAYDASLFWQPTSSLSLVYSLAKTQAFPSLSLRSTPILISQGNVIIDPVTNSQAVIERLSGGNPFLRDSQQTSSALRLSFNGTLFRNNASLSSELTSIHTSNPIIYVVSQSAFFEGIFPSNFVRSLDGRLLRVDTRPFNASYERRRDLSTTLHFNGDFTSHKGDGSPLSWDMNLLHTWTISRTLSPSRGSRGVNLLDTPLDGSIGAPRHTFNLEATLSRSFINLRTVGRWRAGSNTKNPIGVGESYGFRPFLTLDFEALVRVSMQKNANIDPLQLRITVVNALGRRPIVRRSDGTTPAFLDPVLADPLGRTIAIKVLQPF